MSKERRCILYTILVFIFLNDVADFISDWLFFVDIDKMERGLVYGPPAASVWWAILIFSVIGTILFVMETVNMYYETTHPDPWVYSDILSMVVVWIEDIPQVIISLYLVLCREEAISVFQLVKASVVIFGNIIRLIQVGVMYMKEIITYKHHRKVRIAIIIGTVLQTVASIAVFILSFTAPADSGIFFQEPKNLIEETFNNRKYFANVSVFVNHGEYFDIGGLRIHQNHGSHENRDIPVINWMRLDSIDHIMIAGKEDGVHFRLEYEADSSKGILKLAWWKKPDASGTNNAASTSWVTTGCFIVNQTQGTVSEVNTPLRCTQSAGFFTGKSRNAYITFRYISPRTFFRGQIFGDINFNMRLDSTEGGRRACRKVERYTNCLDETVDSSIPLRFQYFQTASHLPPQGTAHFLTDSSQRENIRFFRSDGQDLLGIKDVWETGWIGCKSTGNLAPTMDEKLEISCSRDM